MAGGISEDNQTRNHELPVYSGYEVMQYLGTTQTSRIFRGRRSGGTHDDLVFKEFIGDEITAAGRASWEITITQMLAGHPNVVELDSSCGSRVVCTKDAGESLVGHIGKCTLAETLHIAKQCALALSHLHRHSLIHGDVKPGNFAIDEKRVVRLLDFETVSVRKNGLLLRERVGVTAAYAPPEKTNGSGSNSADHRDDLFSLGVMIHELLTGKRPDVVHINRSGAVPVDFPNAALGRVLVSLLQYSAGQRYQSAWGLYLDLLRLEELHSVQHGNDDYLANTWMPRTHLVLDSLRLHASDSVFGKIAKKICASSDRKAVHFVVVNTHANEGGSNAVQVRRALVSLGKGGTSLVARGTYEPSDMGASALSGVIEAVDGLVAVLQGKPYIGKLQDHLVSNLKGHAPLLTSLGTKVASLFPQCHQNTTEECKAAAATHSVNIQSLTENEGAMALSLIEFISAVCDFMSVVAKDMTLCMYLERMNHAEKETEVFLDTLVRRCIPNLSVVVDYNVDSGSKSFKFPSWIRALSRTIGTLSTVEGQVLTVHEVAGIVAEYGDPGEESRTELAQILVEKTGGNPFYLDMLLQKAYDDGVLEYSYKDLNWMWKIDKISSLPVTGKDTWGHIASSLDRNIKDSLAFAAMLGHEYNTATWHQWRQQDPTGVPPVLDGLDISIRGFVLPRDTQPECWYFLSEEVQKSIIEQREKEEPGITNKMKMTIGWLLLDEFADKKSKGVTDPYSSLERGVIFLIHVSHLVTDPSQRHRLAVHARIVAQRMMLRSGYSQALRLLEKVKDLFEEDEGILADRQLHLNFCLEFAVCCMRTSSFNRCLECLEEAEKLCGTPEERMSIKRKKINALTTGGRFAEIMNMGMSVTNRNMPFKGEVTEEVLREDYERVKGLVQVAETYGMRQTLVVDTLSEDLRTICSCVPAAFFVSPNDYIFMAGRNLILILEADGFCEDSAVALVVYGWVCGWKFDDYNVGEKFGNIGRKLCKEDPRLAESRGAIMQTYNVLIGWWRTPLDDLITSQEEAILWCREVNDTLYEHYSYNAIISFMIFGSGKWRDVAERGRKLHQLMYESNNMEICDMSSPFVCLASAMCGLSESHNSLNVPNFMADAETKDLRGIGAFNRICCKLALMVRNRDYKLGIELANQYADIITFMPDAIPINMFWYFTALCIVRCRSLHVVKGAKSLLEKCMAKLDRYAAKMPAQFAHRRKIVHAAAIRNRNIDMKRRSNIMDDDSLRLMVEAYEDAIRGCREQKSTHEIVTARSFYAEDLADLSDSVTIVNNNSRLSNGEIWNDLWKVRLAGHTSTDTSTATTAELTAHGAGTPRKSAVSPRLSSSGSSQGSGTGEGVYSSTHHDVQWFVMASYMWSNIDAHDADTLLHKALDTVATASMVERAMFFSYEAISHDESGSMNDTSKDSDAPEKYEIVLKARLENHETVLTSGKRMPLEELADDCAIEAVQLAASVKIDVVAHKATHDPILSSSEYVVRSQAQSIAAVPLVQEGKVIGVLYLENKSVSGAFSRGGMRWLSLFAVQVAYSLHSCNLVKKTTELNNVYEKFVPREFLEHLGCRTLAEIDTSQRLSIPDITVVFMDIRSYTSISANLGMNSTFTFLNTLLSIIGSCVKKNKGFIDKYIGDAVLALFPKDALNAVRCVESVIEHIRSDSNIGSDVEILNTGIELGFGIHSGPVVMGVVGDDKRMDVTAIGDTVNLASRLESLCANMGVTTLISDDVAAQVLASTSQSSLRYLGKFQLVGRTATTRIYEVLGACKDREVHRRKETTRASFEAAVDHFAKADLGTALNLFQEVLEGGDDPVARMYVRLCRQNLGLCSTDWSGIICAGKDAVDNATVPHNHIKNVFRIPMPTPLSYSPKSDADGASRNLAISLASSVRSSQDEANDFSNRINVDDENLKTWEMDSQTLVSMVTQCFQRLGVFEHFQGLTPTAVMSFTTRVEKMYMQVPYHNFYHAADVVHALYIVLTKTRAASELLRKETILALLLAALCHDIEHPGVSNNFLKQLEDPLCGLGDASGSTSYLEVMHAMHAVSLLRLPDAAVTHSLSPAERSAVSRIMTSSIIATDFAAAHTRIVEEFRIMVNDHRNPTTGHLDREYCLENDDAQLLLAKVLLKAADVSNIFKPFPVAMQWAKMLRKELIRLGNLQGEYGLDISPFCETLEDESEFDMSGFQSGFINYVMPFWDVLAEGVEGFDGFRRRTKDNLAQWKALGSNHAPSPSQK